MIVPDKPAAALLCAVDAELHTIVLHCSLSSEYSYAKSRWQVGVRRTRNAQTIDGMVLKTPRFALRFQREEHV
jgi:hypothetical protein